MRSQRTPMSTPTRGTSYMDGGWWGRGGVAWPPAGKSFDALFTAAAKIFRFGGVVLVGIDVNKKYWETYIILILYKQKT